MWNVCPKCRHLNSDDSKRCEVCHQRLNGPKPVEQRAPRPVEKVAQTYQTKPAPAYQFKLDLQPLRRRSYFEDWFGPRVPFEQRRRNTMIAVGWTVLFLLAIAYTAAGFYCNTVVWLAFGILVAMAASSIAKGEWSEEKKVAFLCLIVLPMIIIGLVPWPL